MANTTRINWRRISAEFAAIVGSILLAFWIEAWWDDRQDRADEVTQLQAVLNDLIAAREDLIIGRQFNEAILASTVALLRAGADENPQLSSDAVDKHLSYVYFYNNPDDLAVPSITALVQGGDLSAISSVELRNQIVDLSSALENIENHYSMDQKFYSDTLIPYYSANINIPQIIEATKEFPGQPNREYFYPAVGVIERHDHLQLLSNFDFRNFLSAKIDRQLDIINVGYSILEPELDKTIAAIQAELRK